MVLVIRHFLRHVNISGHNMKLPHLNHNQVLPTIWPHLDVTLTLIIGLGLFYVTDTNCYHFRVYIWILISEYKFCYQ